MLELQKVIATLENAPEFNAEAFIASHNEPAVNSFRINRNKINVSPFPNSRHVPWCNDGFYLDERARYAQHPYWHAGAFYVQEASSMFLQEAVKQTLNLNEPLCVLDACAAPGGKSTLLSSLLSPESVLVSNEVIRSRVNILQENIVRWGHANNIITQSDTQQFSKLDECFDAMVVDAPCSGSGLFRKDAAAINEWSEANVNLCSDRQQRIVCNLIPALKVGGVLMYCTCSYSVQENEAMVNWLCAEHALEPVDLNIPAAWNIVHSQKGCYRFYPYKLAGEGFFMAVLRKKGSPNSASKPAPRTLKMLKPDASFTDYLKGDFQYFIHNDFIYAATNSVLELTENLRQHKINLIQCGVEVGNLKGTKFIPAHALALNEALNPSVEYIDVDEVTAMAYLRKQTIALDTTIGYKIIRFEGVNLGWINCIPNRINNMYPTHWRLLH